MTRMRGLGRIRRELGWRAAMREARARITRRHPAATAYLDEQGSITQVELLDEKGRSRESK